MYATKLAGVVMDKDILAVLLQSFRKGKSMKIDYDHIGIALLKKGFKENDVRSAFDFFAKDPKNKVSINKGLKSEKPDAASEDTFKLANKNDKGVKKPDIERKNAQLSLEIESIVHEIRSLSKKHEANPENKKQQDAIKRKKEQIKADFERFIKMGRQHKKEKTGKLFGFIGKGKKKDETAIELPLSKEQDRHINALIREEKEITKPSRLALPEKSYAQKERLTLKEKGNSKKR